MPRAPASEGGRNGAGAPAEARGAQRASLGVLLRTGWLAEQPRSLADRMGAIGRWTRFPSGVALLSVGDRPALFGVAEGEIDLFAPTSEGGMARLDRLRPGDWLGEGDAIRGRTATVAVVAATPATAFQVGGGALRGLLEAEPRFWPCLFALSDATARARLGTISDLLTFPAARKVARRLAALATHGGDIRMNQVELAELVGATRSTVQRALGELEAMGAVDVAYRRIRVRDRAALVEAALGGFD